jgi:hypothetical protein
VSYEAEPWVTPTSEDPSPGEPPTPAEPPPASETVVGGEPVDEAEHTQGEPARLNGGASEPSASTQSVRADAFTVLSQAVSDLRGRNKRSTAAGIKTEMQKLTADGFHEQDLGFDSFREFLEAAEAQGVIHLSRPVPGSGQDVEAYLPAEPIPDTGQLAPRPPGPRKARIRADLWAAFVDHDPQWLRVFDLGTGQASMFPASRRSLEPSEITVLRQRYEESPGKFKEIKFIPLQSKLQWMTRFAEDLDSADAARPVLSAALKSERPLTAFTRATRGLPGIAERWQATFAARVAAVMTEWLAENDLRLDIYDEDPRRRGHVRTISQEPTSAASRTSRARSTSQPGRVDRLASPSVPDISDPLRRELLSVLGQLSTDELLQLKIPIVYALRK